MSRKLRKKSKVISLLGTHNTGKTTPDNLDFLAAEGSGSKRYYVLGTNNANSLIKSTSCETFNLGLLYFETNNYIKDKFKATLELLGIKPQAHYCVYTLRNHNLDLGYITQARFISSWAMNSCFDIRFCCPRQKINIIEALCNFVESEIAYCEEDLFSGQGREGKICKHFDIPSGIEGFLDLGFGFFIENSEYGIYRIWSKMTYLSK
jgi:hypothetical protein